MVGSCGVLGGWRKLSMQDARHEDLLEYVHALKVSCIEAGSEYGVAVRNSHFRRIYCI